jgi:hypothetical protein
MSKRVQRYECDECHAAYHDETDARECEREHVASRRRDAQEKAWREFDDEYSWRLTVEQIEELTRMCESWHGRPPPHP